ncbi:ATP-binding protein [Lysobacter sp. A3-1-A15]|uniref:ATP-binding protein n=1 Tax=Novilysobacter viscosus TaxID=3098602 RepID=UPI002EDAC20C
MSLTLPDSISNKRLPPDPEGTAAFMSRIGYSLEEALSDIIDNSIDAEAKTVLVRFICGKDRINQIIIADDGHGMLSDELHRAMQYGVRQPHRKNDLGKYGIGLKAAAFSQCKALSVLSRKAGKSSGRRWTIESIKDDWRLEELDAVQAGEILNIDWSPADLRTSGTTVILDKLDSLQSAMSDFSRNLQKTIMELKVDLGLRFHRFLQSEDLLIVIDVTKGLGNPPDTQIQVDPLDPFRYPKSGRKGYPATFELEVGNTKVKAIAHIWPAKSKDPNYRLGSGKVAERQGFYFYRNDRLIKAGGWHNLQSDSEPHSSLARVLIEMPPDLDSSFRLSVQKNDFNVPTEFIDAVKASKAGNTTFPEYVKAAQDVYRNAPQAEDVVFFPKSGIPVALSKKMKRLLAGASENFSTHPIDIKWERLDSECVFSYDADERLLSVNSTYRSSITGGRNSVTDAPVFKTMLFFAVQDLLSAGRVSKKLRERIETLNGVLLEALKCQA